MFVFFPLDWWMLFFQVTIKGIWLSFPEYHLNHLSTFLGTPLPFATTDLLPLVTARGSREMEVVILPNQVRPDCGMCQNASQEPSIWTDFYKSHQNNDQMRQKKSLPVCFLHASRNHVLGCVCDVPDKVLSGITVYLQHSVCVQRVETHTQYAVLMWYWMKILWAEFF